jgi:pilus assembly protein FimV
MLVGLYRANRDAFDGNMNSLKVGKVLLVPETSDLYSISQSEATKIVLAQTADWNAYRRTLAGVSAKNVAPNTEEDGKHRAIDKVTAGVESKAVPGTEPKEQSKPSKVDETGGAKRSNEDFLAREQALKEANDRVSGLEKNVADLLKLVELNNQTLAALQKQLAGKIPSVEPALTAASNAITQPPEKLLAPPDERKPTVPTTDKPVDATQTTTIETSAPQPSQSSGTLQPQEVLAVPLAVPAAAPVPPTAKDTAAAEQGFDSSTLWTLASAVLILALLAVYFLIKRRRQDAHKDGLPPSVRDALLARSTLLGKSTLALRSGGTGVGSVVRGAGGQSIDTEYVPPSADFSQAGPGSIDTDDVDLIREADVYMAYGRDAQAEEILLEAKLTDPKRHAIHVKLLEIYAKRENRDLFESLAAELYAKTQGEGAEWEKAAEMGLKLDPNNPLFDKVVHVAVPAATVQPPLNAPVRPPVATVPIVAKAIEDIKVASPKSTLEAAPLDFALGNSQPGQPRQAVMATPSMPEEFGIISNVLDFSLPDAAPAVETALTAQVAPVPNINDRDLDFDLEFDVKMTESTVLGQTMHPSTHDMAPITLNLDLLTEDEAIASDATADQSALASAVEPFEEGSPPLETLAQLDPFAEIKQLFDEQVATKLYLADAYEEMGNSEGAYALLQEVLQEGDSAQREKAQSILTNIDPARMSEKTA